MIALGVGGLARSREFRARWFADLDDQEKDIFQGGDAAAALVVDDRVVAAAAEERFDGVKHSSAFPRRAAAFCLERAGLTVDDVDVVAHSFSYGPHRETFHARPEYYRRLYDAAFAPDVVRADAERALATDLHDRFRPVDHHLAHAASAFIPSGFDDALVVVTDGSGEVGSATVYEADRSGARVLREVPGHSSLGLLYGVFTLYLGFAFGDGEYKVMGLAPYGNGRAVADVIADRWVELGDEGRYWVPLLLSEADPRGVETFEAALADIESILGPRRAPGAPIDQRHLDVAAGLQTVLERVQLHQLRHFRAATGARQLCLAGGVALNCVVNGQILRSGLFDDVYVQPAAGDDGAALGAALHAGGAWGALLAEPFTAMLGPGYDAQRCRDAVGAVGADAASVEVIEDPDRVAERVAELLDDGLVVAWFQGRMEFGPRALGARSILADPRDPNMRDRINTLVKKRESFRPFAPAVPVESVSDWFEVEPSTAHRFSDMLFVAPVRPHRVAGLPAVTHVDGTARVQTVDRDENPRFWAVLRAFERRTGVPVVLNTSFNVAGQPIVRDPDEAVRTFLDARLDALVLEGRLLVRTASREHAA